MINSKKLLKLVQNELSEVVGGVDSKNTTLIAAGVGGFIGGPLGIAAGVASLKGAGYIYDNCELKNPMDRVKFDVADVLEQTGKAEIVGGVAGTAVILTVAAAAVVNKIKNG